MRTMLYIQVVTQHWRVIIVTILFRMLMKHLTSMVHAALLLYRKLTVMLKSCIPHYVDVLKASISLILFAVAQLKICPSDEKDEIIKEAFARLKGTLWEWIVDSKVIGGSVFGGNLPAYYSSGIWPWNPRGELEVNGTPMLFVE